MLNTTFAYFTSTQDWLIVGAIVLVLFGSTKIPQFARGLGEGIREFKKSMTHEEEKKSDDSSNESK